MTLSERFWNKVRKTPTCWLWIGAKKPNGYGKIWLYGKDVRAHRVSWVLTNGPIQDGLCVLHRCDVPLCVNPAHLFLGTRRENFQDMFTKKRHANGDRHGAKTHPESIHRGELNRQAKLTADDVSEIRTLCAGGLLQREAGARFGIHQAYVSEIVRGETWRHTLPVGHTTGLRRRRPFTRWHRTPVVQLEERFKRAL